jgi:hypothetical protein
MAKTGLGRYPSEVRGLAQELDYLLDELDVREVGVKLYKKNGDALFHIAGEEVAKVLKFLKQTPSQRLKTVAKMEDAAAAALILRARYICLMSANAMDFAENFFYVVGMGYRQAAEYAARHAIGANFHPRPEEVVNESSDYW